MEIIYKSFSLTEKFLTWTARLISIACFIFVIIHISERPVLIAFIAAFLLILSLIINEQKIFVYNDIVIIRNCYMFNFLSKDVECIYFKDIKKVETENRTLVDDFVSGFRVRGSKLYIYYTSKANKTLQTRISYTEMLDIVKIINNRINLNNKD